MEKENQITKKLANLSGSESKELLKSLIQGALSDDNDNKVELTTKEKLQRLKDCKESFELKHKFKSGDLVKWKPNLKNRGIPEYEEPVIVIEVLDNPIFDEEEGPSSTYFRERLDIIIGYIADEGEMITFYFDSRRFQPYKTK